MLQARVDHAKLIKPTMRPQSRMVVPPVKAQLLESIAAMFSKRTYVSACRHSWLCAAHACKALHSCMACIVACYAPTP